MPYVLTPSNLNRADAARQALNHYSIRKGENPDRWDLDTIRDLLQDTLYLLQQTSQDPKARQDCLFSGPKDEYEDPEDMLQSCLDRAIRDFPNEFEEEEDI